MAHAWGNLLWRRQVLFAGREPRGEELFGEGAAPGDIAVRLHNHPATLTTIRALKSSSIGAHPPRTGLH